MTETHRRPNPFFPPSLRDIASDAPRAVEELTRIEVHLDVPDGFILGLMRDGDDWTFLLRLHALVEASLEYVIVAKIDRPEIADWVRRHNIAGKTGKLELATLLGAVD